MTTNYTAIDTTRLRDAANGLLQVLTNAAADSAGWEPETMVTVARPGYGCDRIAVWPSRIQDDRSARGCEHVPTVELTYSIAMCIGAAVNEDDQWWAERVDLLDNLWGTLGGLWKSSTDGTLIAAMGMTPKECESLTLNTATRFDAGNLFVWEGSVSFVLGVAEVAS